MTILRLFGLERLSLALEAVDSVHEIWNLLSLESNLHSKFNSLDLWFECTSKVCRSEIPNLCRLSTRVVQLLRGLFFQPVH